MFCKKCGKKVDDDSSFCGYCDCKLVSDAPNNVDAIENNLDEEIKDESEYYSQYPVHPWIRYLARMFDMACFGYFGGIITYVVAALIDPKLADSWWIENDWAFLFLVMGLWMLFEPVLLNRFGTTLGKYILNVKIKSANGSNLTYAAGLTRSTGVFIIGLGLMLPIVSLVTMIVAYSGLTKNKTTPWDKKAQSIVLHGKIGGGRVFVFIASVILLLIIMAVLSS